MPDELMGNQIAFITQQGETLIGKLLAAEEKLRFTRAYIGDGPMPDGQSSYTMQDVSGFVMSAKIEGASSPRNGFAVVGMQVSSLDVPTAGFAATNVALFAQDGTQEICYAYLPLHEHPVWIYPDQFSINQLARFLLGVEVSSVALDHAVINPDVLITLDQMQRYFLTVVRPVCREDARVMVYDEHNPSPFGPETHPEYWAKIVSDGDRIKKLEDTFAGQGSANFFFDFTSELGVPDIPWYLDEGVWNQTAACLEC